MVEINVLDKSFKQTKKDFTQLLGRVQDMRPVWKSFIKFYQDTIIPGSFNTQGKLMGKTWVGYSESYLKQLAAKGESTKVSLRRSDELYNAARGGPGWYDKQGKKTLDFGLNAPAWSGVHQWAYQKQGIPRRDYFLTTQDDLPARAWKFLVMETENYIKGDL